MQRAKPTQRIFIFDILRITLLFLVVHIHFEILVGTPLDFFSRYEYLAVPLFVTLSFFLTAKYFIREPLPVEKLTSRVIRLFIPLVVWSLVGFLPHLASLTLVNVILQVLTGEFVNLSLYYLNLLILFTILCFALSYVPKSLRFWSYGAIILLAFFFQYSHINYNFFHPQIGVWQYSYSRFVELIPYAMLGLFFGLLRSRLEKNLLYSLVIVGIGLIGYYYAISLPFLAGFNYQGLVFFFQVILIFTTVLLLSRLQLKGRIVSWLETVGAYTFGVYLIHYPLLEALLVLIPNARQLIFATPHLSLVLFLTLCFSICYGLDAVTKRRVSFLFR